MTKNLEAPPMSGNNLPVRELKAEKSPAELEQTAKNKWLSYLLIGLLIVLFFCGGLGLGVYLNQKDKGEVLASPSPEVKASPVIQPSSSPQAEGFSRRLEQFEENLEEVDLKEEQLLPPLLDYKIRFEIEE